MWWKLAAFLCCTAVLIVGIAQVPGVTVSEAIAASGLVMTALSLFLGAITLRETHDWNRRHYTVELMQNWNPQTRKHLAYLRQHFPDFMNVPDFIAKPESKSSWEMDREIAKAAVHSTPTDADADQLYLETCDHLIALMNYLEDVSAAYEQHIVDRSAVEDSLGPVMVDTYVYFRPFIDEVRSVSRHEPWPPLKRVVEAWEATAFRLKRETDASDARKRALEANARVRGKSETGNMK